MGEKDHQNLILLIGQMNGTMQALNKQMQDLSDNTQEAIHILTQDVSALKIWRATIVAKVGALAAVAAFAWVFVWEWIKIRFFRN